MSFRPLLGRRLLARLYAYQAVLFALIVGAIILVNHALIAPAIEADRLSAEAWLAEGVLIHHKTEELVPRLKLLNDRLGLGITVFGADGRELATGLPGSSAPLDPTSLAQLERHGLLNLDSKSVAVGELEGNHLARYAVVRRSPRGPSFSIAAVVLVLVLTGLAIGSTLLARAIASPLERLASVTQLFGLGDLRARSDVVRTDEIGDVARSFNQMADRIENLRRAEKELLANVSHELRTPLARVRVVLELAAEEVPAVAQRYLAEITEDLNEVENLLGDIIETARLDLASERSDDPFPPLRFAPASLGQLLRTLADRFQHEHAGRVLNCRIDADVAVSADRVLLKHAVSNLLDNAHKYSPLSRPVELRLHKDTEQQTAIIEVEDRGKGIESVDVEHVFEPFFRSDRSRSRDTGGVGLGLTLARRIVDAHGGTITVRSRLGEGTVVRIALPLRREPS